MLFNLKKNKALMLNHTAQEVAHMDDVQLAQGTTVELERKRVISDTASPEPQPAAKSNDGFIKCRVCKSTNVNYIEKQLRGADEPMTVFARCESCGAKWKM